ncbi:MAG: hypothetical protein LW720_19555 [Pirellula sp.]|nr:hypothetical protein [Pirellula sp.]
MADGDFGFRHQEWLGDLDGVLGMFIDDLIDVRLVIAKILKHLFGRNVRTHQEPAGWYLYPLDLVGRYGLWGLWGFLCKSFGAGRVEGKQDQRKQYCRNQDHPCLGM